MSFPDLSVVDNFSRHEGTGTDPGPSGSLMKLKPIPVCPTSQTKKRLVWHCLARDETCFFLFPLAPLSVSCLYGLLP